MLTALGNVAGAYFGSTRMNGLMEILFAKPMMIDSRLFLINPISICCGKPPFHGIQKDGWAFCEECGEWLNHGEWYESEVVMQ